MTDQQDGNEQADRWYYRTVSVVALPGDNPIIQAKVDSSPCGKPPQPHLGKVVGESGPKAKHKPKPGTQPQPSITTRPRGQLRFNHKRPSTNVRGFQRDLETGPGGPDRAGPSISGEPAQYRRRYDSFHSISISTHFTLTISLKHLPMP